MQTRGVPLVLRHILSNMEHTHTKDPSLAILRDRLAEAEDIASVAAEGYTQVPLVTPLPHCGDDFPILVDNTYSDDDVKALLDRIGSLQHSIRLSKYKMEGFLQRTVTQPLWKLPHSAQGSRDTVYGTGYTAYPPSQNYIDGENDSRTRVVDATWPQSVKHTALWAVITIKPYTLVSTSNYCGQ